MSVYPKWLYHAEHEAKVVRSKEEHEALGEGWAESPADLKKPEDEPEAPKPRSRKPKPSGGADA